MGSEMCIRDRITSDCGHIVERSVSVHTIVFIASSFTVTFIGQHVYVCCLAECITARPFTNCVGTDCITSRPIRSSVGTECVTSRSFSNGTIGLIVTNRNSITSLAMACCIAAYVSRPNAFIRYQRVPAIFTFVVSTTTSAINVFSTC